jgi:hypothetical protein
MTFTIASERLAERAERDMKAPVPDDGLPLARALSSLRAELAEAIEAARQEELRFKVESIEVNLQVVATTSGGGSAELGLWQVVKVGGKLDHSRGATHSVKLTLTPDLAGDTGGGTADVRVADALPERPA